LFVLVAWTGCGPEVVGGGEAVVVGVEAAGMSEGNVVEGLRLSVVVLVVVRRVISSVTA